MCYMTVISTTSKLDLSELNTSLVRFSKDMPNVQVESFLRFPHIWFLGSKDGCSCGFRHLDHGNEELGFSEPVDWWPEDAEDVEAMLQVVGIFKDILNKGERLDCIDAWAKDDEDEPRLAGDLVVNLGAIQESCFRFFEWHRFELTNVI